MRYGEKFEKKELIAFEKVFKSGDNKMLIDGEFFLFSMLFYNILYLNN